jgi:hypothetical protein
MTTNPLKVGDTDPNFDGTIPEHLLCQQTSAQAFVCTRPVTHTGPHIAHGIDGYVCDTWWGSPVRTTRPDLFEQFTETPPNYGAIVAGVLLATLAVGAGLVWLSL